MTNTKPCKKCGETKDLSEFSKCKASKDGLQYWCKPCQRESVKASYQKNKEPAKARAAKQVQEKREWIREQKNKPCADCGGVFDPVCMDFDHLPEHDKTANMSVMYQFPLAKIKEEIAKCEVVCANCHRLRTKERNYLKRN